MVITFFVAHFMFGSASMSSKTLNVLYMCAALCCHQFDLLSLRSAKFKKVTNPSFVFPIAIFNLNTFKCFELLSNFWCVLFLPFYFSNALQFSLISFFSRFSLLHISSGSLMLCHALAFVCI